MIFQSDIEIRKVSLNIKKIKTNTWLPDNKTVAIMQNKHKSNKIWEKAGLCVPRSIIVTRASQLKGNTWVCPLNYIRDGGKMAMYAKKKKDAVQYIKNIMPGENLQ